MFIKKNFRIGPLYKQLLKLRINIQNRTKILKFKKKKWNVFLQNYKKKLKWYNRFKPIDQTKHLITKYPTKGTSKKKQFRNSLNKGRSIRLFYGSLSKKIFKKHLRAFTTKKFNFNYILFLNLFEKRLDTVVFRAKFTKSLRQARQLITHGIVYVNNNQVKYPAYTLKKGDLISINPNYYLIIEDNLKYCLRGNQKLGIKNNQLWPLPPKHLIINYKTLEIVFGNIEISNFALDFSTHLNLEKIILNYSRQ